MGSFELGTETPVYAVITIESRQLDHLVACAPPRRWSKSREMILAHDELWNARISRANSERGCRYRRELQKSGPHGILVASIDGEVQ